MLLMGSGRRELGIGKAWNADARRLQLLQLVAQRPRTDAETLGRQFSAAAGNSQRGEDQFPLALLQIAIQAGLLRRGRSRRLWRGVRRRADIEICGVDEAADG